MSKSFSNHRVLYYPNIEFYDETWLKCAILIWDHIYRIVPQSYKPQDSEAVSIAVEKGFIKNITLTSQELELTANNFIEFTKELAFIPAGFRSSAFQSRLSIEKIDSRLIDYFSRNSKTIDAQGFFHINSNIANGYMFFLASCVSKQRNIQKLTDNDDMFAAMTYFDYDGHFIDSCEQDESEEAVINLIIENALPKDIAYLDINYIIDIANHNEFGKRAFRDKLKIMYEDLCNIDDPSFFSEALDDYNKDLGDFNSCRKKMFSELRQSILPSYLYVGIPTLISNLTGSLISPGIQAFNKNELIKSVVVSLVSTLAKVTETFIRKWREEKNNYYLQIQDKIGQEKGLLLKRKNIQYLLNEYIND